MQPYVRGTLLRGHKTSHLNSLNRRSAKDKTLTVTGLPETYSEVLRGWKEISNYLRCSVRTAQRWESYGIPVHRCGTSLRAPVVAFPEELDQWTKQTWNGSSQDHLLQRIALLKKENASLKKLREDLQAKRLPKVASEFAKTAAESIESHRVRLRPQYTAQRAKESDMQPRTRLLFVDDERSIRETLSSILRRHGFTVTLAATVPEALQLIDKQEFDILLCDLNIQREGDGFVVIRAMQATHPGCETVILTAYPGVESAIEGIRLHIEDYLIKPANAEALLALLAERLVTQPNLQPEICQAEVPLIATG